MKEMFNHFFIKHATMTKPWWETSFSYLLTIFLCGVVMVLLLLISAVLFWLLFEYPIIGVPLAVIIVLSTGDIGKPSFWLRYFVLISIGFIIASVLK